MRNVFGICAALRRRLLLAFAFVAVISLATPWQGGVAAQEPPDPTSVSQRVAAWSSTLEKLSHDVNTLKLDATQLEALSDQAVDIRSQAVAFTEELKPFADEAHELHDAFVSASPGDADESPEIKAQGKELEGRVAQYEGWLREIDLTLARADQLLDRISSRRLAQLAKSLAERGPLPINPFVWGRAAEESWALARFTASGVTDSVRLWLQPGSETGVVAASVLGIALAAFFVTSIGLRLITRRTWPVLGPTLNGPACRIVLAVLRSAAPWVAAVTAAGLAAPLKDWLPLLPGRTVVLALLGMSLTAATNIWILRAAVTRPPLGVAPVATDDADRSALARVYAALLTLFSLDAGLQIMTSTFTGLNLIAVWALIVTLVGSYYGREAVAVINRLLTHHGFADSKLIRLLLLIVPAAVAAVSIMASVLGYAQFGDYVFSNSLASALALFAAYGLRQATHDIVVRVCDIDSPAGRVLRDKLGADQPALRLAQFWLGIALDLAGLVATAVALMVVWGTGIEDAVLMLQRLVEGIRVGNVTLSLADLVIAIVTFVVGVWITRFAQKILERRVFPGTQLDLGVRNSLRSGLGYIGVIVAGAIAVMALGINLSNLAIVAGALSVGIGFGLQNIINNFVSGLILLIERPVKVGDWISVGSNEGIVKRINVRSTEITTGSRASVLVPNADFLSVSVTNWTHKDKGGRLQLTFHVPESMGAEGGRDMLLACAKAHPKVLSDPPISILLQEIGGGYTFGLEADVADVTTMKEVASDLRFAVDRALRAGQA